MKKTTNLLLVILAVILASCGGTSRTVPVTGRKQTVYSDNATFLSQSLTEYQGYVKKAKLSTNATNTAMVKRVGQRLANAVEVSNSDGNIKLSKRHKDDTERIDPIAAAMNALVRALTRRSNPTLADAIASGGFSL